MARCLREGLSFVNFENTTCCLYFIGFRVVASFRRVAFMGGNGVHTPLEWASKNLLRLRGHLRCGPKAQGCRRCRCIWRFGGCALQRFWASWLRPGRIICTTCRRQDTNSRPPISSAASWSKAHVKPSSRHVLTMLPIEFTAIGYYLSLLEHIYDSGVGVLEKCVDIYNNLQVMQVIEPSPVLNPSLL